MLTNSLLCLFRERELVVLSGVDAKSYMYHEGKARVVVSQISVHDAFCLQVIKVPFKLFDRTISVCIRETMTEY